METTGIMILAAVFVAVFGGAVACLLHILREIAALRKEMAEGFAEMRTEMRTEMAEMRRELLAAIDAVGERVGGQGERITAYGERIVRVETKVFEGYPPEPAPTANPAPTTGPAPAAEPAPAAAAAGGAE